MTDALSGVVYEFEDLGEGLHLLPLAARRALDVGGFRLSLEGWQSLGAADRAALALEGAKDLVDKHIVEDVVGRSTLPATRIRPVPDPDPLSPPEQLNAALAALVAPRVVEPAHWSRLRALDRYALIHVLRRSIAHADSARLETAAKVVLARLADSRDATAAADLRRTMRSRVPETLPVSSASEPSSGLRSEPAPEDPVVSVAPFSDAVTIRPRSAPPPRTPLTHVDQRGDVRMVDVGDKPTTSRRAVASGLVRMNRETADRLSRNDVPKGEVLATARIAGIQAAKRTPELIPLCHAVALTRVEVAIEVDAAVGVCRVTATAEALDRTGVEMEALTATSVACLTIYDMLKAIDRDMVVSDIQLIEKTGGQRGPYSRGAT